MKRVDSLRSSVSIGSKKEENRWPFECPALFPPFEFPPGCASAMSNAGDVIRSRRHCPCVAEPKSSSLFTSSAQKRNKNIMKDIGYIELFFFLFLRKTKNKYLKKKGGKKKRGSDKPLNRIVKVEWRKRQLDRF